MVRVLALLGLGVLIAVFGGGGFLALLGVVVVYPTAAYMGYAVCAKRWHDRNKSGWWSLIGLTGIGAVWMVIELGFLEGTDGPNKYAE